MPSDLGGEDVIEFGEPFGWRRYLLREDGSRADTRKMTLVEVCEEHPDLADDVIEHQRDVLRAAGRRLLEAVEHDPAADAGRADRDELGQQIEDFSRQLLDMLAGANTR